MLRGGVLIKIVFGKMSVYLSQNVRKKIVALTGLTELFDVIERILTKHANFADAEQHREVGGISGKMQTGIEPDKLSKQRIVYQLSRGMVAGKVLCLVKKDVKVLFGIVAVALLYR